MNFCPGCGTALNNPATAEPAAEVETAAEVVTAEVRIAEINAKRDVDLARINARVTENITEVEQVAELAAAEATAEALESVISPPETETPDEPVVVVNAPEAEADTEDAPEPPEASEPSTEPGDSKHTGYGSPGWFG